MADPELSSGTSNSTASPADMSAEERRNQTLRQSDMVGSSNPSRVIPDKTNDGNTVGQIRLPEDVPMYYVELTISEYRRTNWNTVGSQSIKHTIILPLPVKINDTHSIVLDEVALSPVLIAGSSAIMGSNQKALVDGLGAAGGLATRVAAGRTGAAGSAALGAAGAFGGAAFNNGILQLFKNPTFKKPTMTWKISPNSPSETQALSNLYQILNSAQAPSLGGSTVGNLGAAFWGYPDLVYMKFKNQTGKTPLLHAFKPMFIEKQMWDFSPEHPSFYAGTLGPESCEFTIQFSEQEYWIKGDDFVNGGASQN